MAFYDKTGKKREANVLASNAEALVLPASVATQWQLGDWPSLRALSLEWLEQQEGRANLAAVVAIAHYQSGDYKSAQNLIDSAITWGASRNTVASLLAAGALNSLGRSRLLLKDAELAHELLKKSLRIDGADVDEYLLTPVKAKHQSFDLNISPQPVENCWAKRGKERAIASPDRSETEDSGSKLASSNLTAQLTGILSKIIERLAEEGSEIIIDGIKAFDQEDPFLSGKIVNALAYWVSEHPVNSDITLSRCTKFRRIIMQCQELDVQSWGIYFYLRGLQRLNANGLLSQCFSFTELSELEHRLDWRTFVKEEDYSLIKKPNNFYSIAYSIAFLRYQLGWDDIVHSDRLIERELDHYEQVSGGGGFADETKGKGRYDRYSFLLIAEVSNRFNEAGYPLTESMKRWLRASAEYVLFNANLRGDGFQYGRSIGAYGDSAFLEILTSAAANGVLKSSELLPAYGFCQKITQKFLNFWWVEERQSVNIWSEGRATDAYRGKHRILGENLSLLYQHIYCHRIWSDFIDLQDKPNAGKELQSWIDQLPKEKLTRFTTNNDCDYALFTFRDGKRIINLPLINGDLHYRQMAYHTIPFITDIVQPVPDLEYPVLVPIIVTGAGERYVSYPCFTDVKLAVEADATVLSWTSSEATGLTKKYPIRERLFDSDVSVEFQTGKISRKEILDFDTLDSISAIEFIVPVREIINKLEGDRLRLKDNCGSHYSFSLEVVGGAVESSGYEVGIVNSVEGKYDGFYRFLLNRPVEKKLQLSWCFEYSELN